MDNCLFCGIINNSVPSLKIYEGKHAVAVLNIKPATKGHAIVIPKNHQAYLHSLNGEELLDLMSAIRSVTMLLSQSLNPTGFNIINNMGPGAGQKLPHLTFEVIPRYENDGLKIEIPQKDFNQEELVDTQKRILNASRENTISTLKAIKEGKIQVSDEVKAEAEKILTQVTMNKDPLNTANKQYSKKLDNILND